MPPGNQSGQEAEPCVRLEQARKASWRSGTGKSEYRLYGALQPRQRGTAGVGEASSSCSLPSTCGEGARA